MAIIHCPGCGKRISDMVKACPHCDIPLGKLDDEEIRRIEKRRWSKRVYQAKNLTYLAMTMMIVGVLWWWMAGWTPPAPTGAVLLIATGVVGYVASRGWLFWLRMPRNRPRRVR